MNDPFIQGVLWAVVIFFALFLLVKFVLRLKKFNHQLTYLKREIERSTGRERSYWLRQKRRLWKRLLLPFYRR